MEFQQISDKVTESLWNSILEYAQVGKNKTSATYTKYNQ